MGFKRALLGFQRPIWTVLVLLGYSTVPAFAVQNLTINEPLNSKGFSPQDSEGKALNLNFEDGTLRDWTATGTAFEQQPIKGNIDQNRLFGEGRSSDHTGSYWIGGYEKLQDGPKGTLTSVPFLVNADWCSFLVGGGDHIGTRVELVDIDADKVITTVVGRNAEEMAPFVFNLQPHRGKRIVIRIVDEETGGWGHVNFDDFRFHDQRPTFQREVLSPVSVQQTDLYPYSNLSGEEAASVMQVPPGFRVQVAAHEPDVRQPIAMCFDDRGRLWVAENYTYPQKAAPGEGKDRIVIFEDTDQDGVFDSHKVFIDGLNLITGFQVGFGGVWVGAAPELFFIPDANGDDIPDANGDDIPDGLEGSTASGNTESRKPSDIPPGATVILDGWGLQDTHETLNTFKWGPDGWLYGCHGVFTHSKVGAPGTPDDQRQQINAGVWRLHPVTHKFEVFAHGTSNPWGVDWNENGDAFITVCVIPHLFQVIPAARYERQAGTHFNEHTYDVIKTIARHRHYVGNQWNKNDQGSSDNVGGGHAHAGAMFYNGGAWPEEYRDKLFMNNIHGNRINTNVLIPEGSGYAGDRNPDFLLTGDKWSQMLALEVGPDGQVWAIDWYDQEQCHLPAIDAHDRSNGRIYRISYADAPNVKVDLASATNDQLLEYALHAENEWYARHARRILQERSAKSPLQFPAKHPALVKVRQGDTQSMLRKLWVLYGIGQFAKLSQAEMNNWLSSESPTVRAWSLRLAAEVTRSAAKTAGASKLTSLPKWLQQRIEELAVWDSSSVVRLEIASILQSLPAEDRWTPLQSLLAHSEDAADQNLPYMYWYAAEPLAEADPQRALALAMSAGDNLPMVRDFMIRRLGSGNPEDSLALLLEGLKNAETDSVRLTFLKGMRGAVSTSRDITVPKDWQSVYQKLAVSNEQSRNFDVYLYTLGLGARFGNPEAASLLRQIVLDEAGARDERRVGYRFLVEDRDADLVKVSQRLLAGATLRTDAVKTLARVDDLDFANAVIEAYPRLTNPEQADARNALASRASYAEKLLQAVGSNKIPVKDLSADLVRQLRNLQDENVTLQVDQIWGQVHESSVDTQAEIARLTHLIENHNGGPVSLELGRDVFARTCQQCHTLFGVGGNVGPDITGSNRTNLDYLLSNIVDPSAVMAQEYRPHIVVNEDGRVITGVLKEESATAIVLQTTTELVTILKDEIEFQKQSELSMMPAELLNTLSPEEIRSLVAYLGSPRQMTRQLTETNSADFFDGQTLNHWTANSQEEFDLWSVQSGQLVSKPNGLGNPSSLTSEFSAQNSSVSGNITFASKQSEAIQLSVRNTNQSASRYVLNVKPDEVTLTEGENVILQEQMEISDSLSYRFQIQAIGESLRFEVKALGSDHQNQIQMQIKAVEKQSGTFRITLAANAAESYALSDLKIKAVDLLPPHTASGSPWDRWPTSTALPADTKISWTRRELDLSFRSEGVSVADFNQDGKLDVAAGCQWYENLGDGRWATHQLMEEIVDLDPKTYSNTFLNFAHDVDKDGWIDHIVVGFPGSPTTWYRNPAGKNGPWKGSQVISETNGESPLFSDFIGNGQPVLISGIENRVLAYSHPTSFPEARWKSVAVSQPDFPNADRFSHGTGIGDINHDGRADLIVPSGWWEQPEDPTNQSAWVFHPADLGPFGAQMVVYDFNGDGRNDVIGSSPHGFGIWWFEQIFDSESGNISFKKHLIDETFSQLHAVVLADINGDGQPDLVTGRRHFAHNGNDPGEDGPALLIWFELKKTPEGPVWIKHQIDDNSGVGTQFEVVDINGDGLLDIVTSNKKGTYVHEQVRTPSKP